MWFEPAQCSRIAALAITAFASSGCAIIPDDGRPQVRVGAEMADKYVHRGMPQNRNAVLQATTDVTLPTKNGQAVAIGMFANMDMRSSTGAAWFPGGHGGRITEFDLTGTYAHTFENGVKVATGVQNYTLPNGESFPNGPREQTNELFVHVQKEFLGAVPELQIRHDVDQANGTYLRLLVNEDFPLTDKLTLRLGSHIGWSSKAQSLWNYGLADSGLADLGALATLDYAFDARTTIGGTVNASTIVDSGLRDWFDLIGIDSENYWISVFVSWTL
jgi:hypothetical protein